ncbi:hypothetical protein AB3K92_13010 [Burkholderia sp. Bmkn7]|uniref:hypothetical protein n=1 Tax=Burkholderia TaxID=32008 RepID=UPI002147EEFA|nr:hypothetical protein [Burkholderia cepacia]
MGNDLPLRCLLACHRSGRFDPRWHRLALVWAEATGSYARAVNCLIALATARVFYLVGVCYSRSTEIFESNCQHIGATVRIRRSAKLSVDEPSVCPQDSLVFAVPNLFSEILMLEISKLLASICELDSAIELIISCYSPELTK